ncbi:MAG: GIY-YIG nuclease family protein, partial [bacterium]|nr:GIY-YIG nuclease family protein [bacterium]
MRKGYVYLIRQGQSDLYKIGHTTKKPINRLKELQTGNPETLVLIDHFQSKYYKDIETLMHTHNSKFHVT